MYDPFLRQNREIERYQTETDADGKAEHDPGDSYNRHVFGLIGTYCLKSAPDAMAYVYGRNYHGKHI